MSEKDIFATQQEQELLDRLCPEEKLTSAEQAYLDGWMDASSLKARQNPFSDGTVEHFEYNRGYAESFCDEDRNGLD